MHYENDHVRNCHSTVRQCLTCGGRMCDCGWPDPEFRLFRCIDCARFLVKYAHS